MLMGCKQSQDLALVTTPQKLLRRRKSDGLLRAVRLPNRALGRLRRRPQLAIQLENHRDVRPGRRIGGHRQGTEIGLLHVALGRKDRGRRLREGEQHQIERLDQLRQLEAEGLQGEAERAHRPSASLTAITATHAAARGECTSLISTRTASTSIG